MKCITLFFSFCLIAIFSIAQPNYDFSKLKRERLGRGVIAIRENPSTVAVSWRYLSSDPMNESFDIYRNDEKINKHPLKDATFFQDAYAGTESVLYTVKAREGKTESNYQLPANESKPARFPQTPKMVRLRQGKTIFMLRMMPVSVTWTVMANMRLF